MASTHVYPCARVQSSTQASRECLCSCTKLHSCERKVLVLVRKAPLVPVEGACACMQNSTHVSGGCLYSHAKLHLCAQAPSTHTSGTMHKCKHPPLTYEGPFMRRGRTCLPLTPLELRVCLLLACPPPDWAAKVESLLILFKGKYTSSVHVWLLQTDKKEN